MHFVDKLRVSAHNGAMFNAMEPLMSNTQPVVHQPPALDIDAYMAERFGQKNSPRNLLERRVVWNLLKHLEAAGWHVRSVHDGEELTIVSTPKAAMELVFNLDDCRLHFSKVPYRAAHTVVLVLGNGVDCIADMSIGEQDGWTVAIDAFDAEVFA